MTPNQNVKSNGVNRDTHTPPILDKHYATYNMAQFKHLLYTLPPSPSMSHDNEDNQKVREAPEVPEMLNLPQSFLKKFLNKTQDSKKDQVGPVGIQSVPQETILHVATFLSQADRCHLAQTCRGFSILMKTPLHEQDENEDHHALWWACVNNNADLFKRALGEDLTLINYRFKEHHSTRSIPESMYWSMHFTPLILALKFRADQVLLLLLKSGVDVNLADEMPLVQGTQFMGHRRQWLPINWGVHLMNPGMDFDLCIGLLVAYGANPNQAPLMLPWESPEDDPRPGDQMPLFEQLELALQLHSSVHVPIDDLKDIYEKRRSRIISLLEVGADAKAVHPYTFHTALHHLAQRMVKYEPREHLMTGQFAEIIYDEVIIPHCLQTFEMLIYSGAQLSALSWDYDSGLRTPLHVICTKSGRYEEIINYFLRNGMDINVADSYGRTPIYEVLEHPPSDLKVLSRFIDKGVNIHHRDNMLRTPLHAVCNGYRSSQERLRQMINILLQRGASATITDLDEKTPLDLLLATSRIVFSPELIQTLRNAERRTPAHMGGTGRGGGRGGRGGRGRGGRGG
ncbi:ankyrin [Annulohypoxylon maeteangense]|uniref:ankyrin n=1 Tax=Annulohypoxylon maeteangense TaxID=1927788 RepID=UPI002008B731|nr:ankyrin [Annulohypoxylon maeteangense]KAI0882355.1 ankyrin [Annulohypoxylon maeteangense]